MLQEEKMKKQLKFSSKFFSELTTHELYEIVRSRTQIFLMEQKIICQDFDGVDYDALHCFLEQDGRVVAYLRAYRSEDSIKIGRVLSLVHGIGLGSQLLERSIPVIVRTFDCDRIALHSQKHAQAFYEKAGFRVCSEDFMEEGIPHVSMELLLK